MSKFLSKAVFYLRFKIYRRMVNSLNKTYWKILGLRIGKKSSLYRIYITWPHKVSIGNNCNIEHNVFFKFDGIYSPEKAIIIGNGSFIGNHVEFNISQKITIGDNCLIAAGCKFVDHDHGMDKNSIMKTQKCFEAPIFIEDDVWVGANAVVLKGVSIGKGAVVASGSIVNGSIPPYEIWGGIPAKKIGERK